ncbi:helix-turn-helix domain-containing protein [Micromonospora aurantiaca]|uniref:helix-turn-helix domain-containing protein n=1 Tax=Micromonospora aurantiaca (nom. illeg.) TaxID=47850 RepID=UPI00379DEA09
MNRQAVSEELWSIDEVSAFLRVPVGTLYQWRHRRIGPRAAKVGRHLRYNPADVRAWLEERAA